MKRIALMVLPLLALLPVISSWKNKTTLTLSQALAQGIVKVKMTGSGGHSGKCISLQIENLKKKDIALVLEAGHVLNSANDGEQDLLVVHEQAIALDGEQKRTLPLEGFCCQLKNHSPGKGSGFNIGKTGNEKLVKLCTYMKGKPIPNNLVQEAIWCVSDDSDPSNLATGSEDKNNALVNDLRKYVCSLLNKPDPWYSTPQSRRLDQERQIRPNPVEVFGEINYTLKSASPINAELRNFDNETVCTMNDGQPMPAGTFNYYFHIKASGFPKGQYHVILKAGTEQIMDKEFTL